jgi:GDP-L-fucose synthase
MKLVILGASGFAGRTMCDVAREAELDFAVASRSTGVDLSDVAVTKAFLLKTRPDFIVNCAAHVGSLNYVTQQAADIIVDNARMILGMYESVREACPLAIVINPIANCAYPAKADTFVEDGWWDGHLHRSVFSYGGSRRFLWTVGECFAMQHGIRSISLLVPNMYGPYDSTDPNKAHALNALVSKFVKAKKEGKKSLEIWGTGVAIREWLYARDFAAIVLRILKNPGMVGLDEPVNVAQNFGLSVRELVTIIHRHIGFDGEIRFDATKPDGAPKKVMDDRRFRKVFSGFDFTDLDEGIAQTVRYYESVYPY